MSKVALLKELSKYVVQHYPISVLFSCVGLCWMFKSSDISFEEKCLLVLWNVYSVSLLEELVCPVSEVSLTPTEAVSDRNLYVATSLFDDVDMSGHIDGLV